MRILPTAIGEFLCHTGTRSFVRSRAVSDHCTIVRNLADVLLQFVGRHADRTRQFPVRFRPRRWISRIDKRERLPAIQPLSYFVHCDSCCLHNALLLQVKKRQYHEQDKFLWRMKRASQGMG